MFSRDIVLIFGFFCLIITIVYFMMKKCDSYIDFKDVRLHMAEIEKQSSRRSDPDELLSLARQYHSGRLLRTSFGGIIRDKNDAMRMYRRAEKVGRDNARICGAAALGIASLYEESGDARSAIEAYLRALSNGYEEAILSIGRLYQHGLHPNYLPDKLTAGRFYNEFKSLTPTLSPWMRLGLKELAATHYGDLDTVVSDSRTIKLLPSDICARVHESLIDRGDREWYPHMATFQADWLETDDDDGELEKRVRESMVRAVATGKERNDIQNAHDIGVTNSSRNVIDRLDRDMNLRNGFENARDEFLEFCTCDDARKVLETLSTNNHSKFDKSERDVFEMVWHEIMKVVDSELCDNLKRAFEVNLASAIENGLTVCSTGKIERMLSTLDLLNPDDALRPEWVIREEIGSLISNKLTNCIDEFGDDARIAYNEVNASDEQRLLVVSVKDCVLKRVKKECDELYVVNNVLSEEVVKMIIESLMHYI